MTGSLHALLICCSSDYDTLRAVNLLGHRRTIACLHNHLRRCPEGLESIPYPWNELTDPAARATLVPMLNARKFDEVFLIVPRPDVAQILAPFLDMLTAPRRAFVCGDRIQPDLASVLKPPPWIVPLAETSAAAAPPVLPAPLYAIIGAYNEADLIFATVRQHFLNGAERVFVVDNNSDDGTREEAIAAGADIHEVFVTPEYNEMHRMVRLNDAVDKISAASGHDEIWWAMSDVDEFLEAPEGGTLRAFLDTLPAGVRAVGARQINYFPTRVPAYVQRQHPRALLTEGEVFDARQFFRHCPAWHWKHPVFRWRRAAAEVRARSGFHVLHCTEQLHEPAATLNLHHFPFREREATFRRYFGLCDTGRNSGYNKVAVGGQSTIQKRRDNLEAVYAGRWGEVYIQPGTIKDESQRGVQPGPVPYRGPFW